MARPRILIPAFACLLVLGSVSPTWAANVRVSWRHSTGHFEQLAGRQWMELTPAGITHRYVEQARNPEYVQLYDASRDCHVRLYWDRCDVRFGAARYRTYYLGHWANR
jgi:hypothetical protein